MYVSVPAIRKHVSLVGMCVCTAMYVYEVSIATNKEERKERVCMCMYTAPQSPYELYIMIMFAHQVNK